MHFGSFDPNNDIMQKSCYCPHISDEEAEAEELPGDHPTNKGWSWDLNPGGLALESLF